MVNFKCLITKTAVIAILLN